MADIDKLRGSPSGHTAKSSNSSKTLKEAATIAATVVMATTPMATQAQNTERDPVDDGHKIEVVEQPRSSLEQQYENTINYFDVVADAEKQKTQEDSPTQAEPDSKKLTLEDIQDIKYYSEDKCYVIQCKDGSEIAIEESALKQRKIEKEAKKEHKEHFSEPVTVERETLSNEDIANQIHLTGQVMSGAYDPETNTITMYDYDNNAPENVSEETKQVFAKIGEALNNEEIDISTQTHELSHAEDFNNRKFAIDVNQAPGQIHRKNYDTEIKANIAEAAMCLEKYKKSGNIEDFNIANSGDLKEFKEWLQQNPDKADSKECKLKLAKAVHDGWLETNNKEGSAYYMQAQRAVEMRDITGGSGFTVYANEDISVGAIVENEGNIRDYLKVQKDLFSDTALGDVSSVCCGYVELGAGATLRNEKDVLQAQTQAEMLVQGMAEGTRSTSDAANKIEDALKVVKKADKDGKRTDKEQAKIDNMLQQACDNVNSQNVDGNKKDAVTIAQKTGRDWKNKKNKQKDGGNSMENVKDNTNVASMVAMQQGGYSH